MTDEELIGKVVDVWTRETNYKYRIVLREHERGFTRTTLKLEGKRWVTLQHRVFVTQEIAHG